MMAISAGCLYTANRDTLLGKATLRPSAGLLA